MGGWQTRTDESLIDYAESHHSGDFAAAPAMEMQRCLIVAIRDFSAESGKQAHRMIRLTEWIIALTVVLGVIAVLQLVAMVWGGA